MGKVKQNMSLGECVGHMVMVMNGERPATENSIADE